MLTALAPVANAVSTHVANPTGTGALPWGGDGGVVVPWFPGPTQQRLALSAGGAGANTDGGYCEVPTAAALEPTAAFSWLWRAYSLDASGYGGAGATFLSQWDVVAAKCRLTCYRNVTNDTQIVMAHSNTGADVLSATVFTNTGVWTENAEHEIAFVFDGAGVDNPARAKLYLDGALPTQNHFGTWPAALTAPGAPMNFGARKGSTAHFPFSGYLWDVRVYNVAMSAAQVAAAYADPDDATLPAPVARWKFTETAGATYTSSPGGFVATPTALGSGRAPIPVIPDWLGGGDGSGRSVMPLGDSFARGFGALEINGWRAQCRNRLYSVFKKRIDFVGPFNGGAASPAGFTDIEHAGVDGHLLDLLLSSDDMLGVAASRMSTFSPDIVVIWGGYNDAAAGDTHTVMLLNLEAVVRAVGDAKPGVKMIICTIPRPNNGVTGPLVDLFNDGVPTSAATLVGEGYAVTVADVRASTALVDLIPTDNIHTHRIGYDRAALVLANAINAVL